MTEPLDVSVHVEKTEDAANAAPVRNSDGTWAKGNPGKAKGTRHMTTRLKEAIQKVYEGTGETADALIIKSIVEKAIKGHDPSQKMIFEYIDGKPTQLIAGDPDGNPIESTITVHVKHV